MSDERLKGLLRATMILPADQESPRDLWRDVASRFEQSRRWSYVDLGLGAAAAVVLVIFPEWFWLLTYHL